MTANREWVQPGAKVAIYSSGWSGGRVTGEDVIARVLKRDIVLESGRRFYFRNEYSSEPIELGDSSSYRTLTLLPADHPRVRGAERAHADNRARGVVADAHEQFRIKATVGNADTLIAAVEAWKALQPQEAAS